MFSIVITERGGAQRQLDFDSGELGIGRVEDNDVVLPRSNVSKRHARLVLKDDRYVLIDLKSTNGTYVNGRRIAAPMLVGVGDKIYIGDFILALLEPSRSRLADVRVRAPAAPLGALSPRSVPAAAAEAPPTARVFMPAPVQESPPVPTSLAEALGGARRSSGPPPLPPGARSHTPLAFGVVSGAPSPLAPSMPTLPTMPAPPPPSPVPEPEAAPAPESSDPALSDERPTAERLRPVSGAPPARTSSIPPRLQDPESAQGPATSPAVLAPSVRLQGALQTLMERLALRMDVSDPKERAFPSEHQAILEGLIDNLAAEGVTSPDLDRRFLTQAAMSEAVGLGPLDRLLNNRSVREVVVDGPSRILADVGGGLSPVSSFFSSSRAVQDVLRRLFARAGKTLGTAPLEEAQLPDGSTVHVLLPPLSPAGPLISIRCPPRTPVSPDGLVTEGALSIDMLSLLRASMQRRLNVLVVGSVASGVSTLVSALASLCQDHERIVTLQEAPSLAIRHPHVLALSLAGEGAPGMAEVLRHAARLRADRLVIDDMRGTDALAVLGCAVATRGVLVGMHAPSPAAALEQLELFAQVALGGARSSLAGLIAQAFSVIVHAGIDGGGARRVLSISEVRGARDQTLDLAVLHRYDGGFRATDQRATFL